MKLGANLFSIIMMAIFGGVIGFFGGPVFVLIPWAFFGLCIGVISSSRPVAVLCGAIYGFFASYSFLISGYDGASSVFTKLIPFAIMAVFGAICASVLAIIGFGFWHRKGDQPPVL